MKKYLLFSLAFLMILSPACDRNDRDDDDDKTSKFTNEDALFLEHDGLNREYLLHIPDGYDGSTPLPLLFNFHGFGGTATEHMKTADMRSLADSEHFILVYPQGSLLDGSSHWNAALDTPDNKSDTDDLGFMEVLIDEIAADYAIDSERIYACGFSNGGFFSYALACYLSDRIAAIGSVSGTMLDTSSTCVPIHPTAMINIHGTDDTVIPYEGSSETISNDAVINYWINHNNTVTNSSSVIEMNGGNTIEYYIYDGGDGAVSVVHYKVVGGGHDWFDLDFQEANTEELIWNFLSQYDINGLR